MANKLARELHALDDDDLLLRQQEAQNELIGLRFNLATRKTENTASVREARKQIARIKTILREREQEEE
jgi:large subunit ribosomal protein L29